MILKAETAQGDSSMLPRLSRAMKKVLAEEF
jgi:hypothetical protein